MRNARVATLTATLAKLLRSAAPRCRANSQIESYFAAHKACPRQMKRRGKRTSDALMFDVARGPWAFSSDVDERTSVQIGLHRNLGSWTDVMSLADFGGLSMRRCVKRHLGRESITGGDNAALLA